MNNIDPFLREVIRYAFDAIADNMALTLMRTSHSGIVRDSLDFSTALSDATGQTIAQGVCTPMHLGCFQDAVSKVIHDYEGKIYPEDVLGLTVKAFATVTLLRVASYAEMVDCSPLPALFAIKIVEPT